MPATSSNKPPRKAKAPKRGKRLEVRMLPLKTGNSETTGDKEVVLDLKSPVGGSSKKALFSRPQRRKTGLGRDEGVVGNEKGLVGGDGGVKSGDGDLNGDEGGMTSSDGGAVCHQPTQDVTFSCFNNHDNDNYRNDDDINNTYNDNTNNKNDNDNEAHQLTSSLRGHNEDIQLPDNQLKSHQNLSQSQKKALVWKARKKKCISYLKKIIGFLLSTLGLFILLFSYTILGGIIFHEIESPNEISTKSGVRASLKYHVELLWNSTEVLNILKKKQWSEMALRIIDNYTRVVYIATKNEGWDGKDDSEAELQWSFAGSLLYCVTVITTIGYGHIAPKTDLGRVVTILYAIFGIPLCLLSITHVGGFMATVFRFLYKNIFCGLCCFCCNKIKDRRLVKAPTEKNKKSTDKSKKCCRSCGWCGCCGKKEDEDHHCTPSKEGLLPQETLSQTPSSHQTTATPASATKRLRQSYKTIVKWRRGIHNALFTADNKNIQVPIYISLLLIGGYIALGALLFGLWEREWNFLIGSYFCFITLSTIGFGDFVPGTSLDPSSSQEKLVLCTLYLIIGLALLAMCFDLMQEEARSIFVNLAKKLGLISEKEEGGDGERSGEGGVSDFDFTTSV